MNLRNNGLLRIRCMGHAHKTALTVGHFFYGILCICYPFYYIYPMFFAIFVLYFIIYYNALSYKIICLDYYCFDKALILIKSK
jgi:hypothetical protein